MNCDKCDPFKERPIPDKFIAPLTVQTGQCTGCKEWLLSEINICINCLRDALDKVTGKL